MENEANMGKGILFAVGGMVAGFAVWVTVIALFGIGTGGLVGGALGGALGALVGLGFQKGSGEVNAAGYAIIVVITLIGAVGALLLGTTIYVYNLGIGRSLGDALGFMLDDRTMRFALIQDLLISGAIAAGMAISVLIKSGKDEEKLDDL